LKNSSLSRRRARANLAKLRPNLARLEINNPKSGARTSGICRTFATHACVLYNTENSCKLLVMKALLFLTLAILFSWVHGQQYAHVLTLDNTRYPNCGGAPSGPPYWCNGTAENPDIRSTLVNSCDAQDFGGQTIYVSLNDSMANATVAFTINVYSNETCDPFFSLGIPPIPVGPGCTLVQGLPTVGFVTNSLTVNASHYCLSAGYLSSPSLWMTLVMMAFFVRV